MFLISTINYSVPLFFDDDGVAKVTYLWSMYYYYPNKKMFTQFNCHISCLLSFNLFIKFMYNVILCWLSVNIRLSAY
ncbi:hypothetical protein PAHAL_2G083200 [Panicum hallii]|jgi:hypothetical protein|uniref:Uncharacterized protein n=1 Tax=Panicum hallii TaxID=206008 RepID=A0A2S3GWT8_9POAL|nr:hypothetical protein PAHAL_2G083200 [Panicum hallii]